MSEQDRGRLIIILTRAAWLARMNNRPEDAEQLLTWARAVRDGTLP